MQENFTVTNEQYGRGFKLEEYNGLYSITAANKGNDGKIYNQWVFIQGKDRQPIPKGDGTFKSIPVKITLGSSVNEAIERLQGIVRLLQTETQRDGAGQGAQLGNQEYYSEQGGNPAPQNNIAETDLPF